MDQGCLEVPRLSRCGISLGCLNLMGGAFSDVLVSVEWDTLVLFHLCALSMLGLICTLLRKAAPNAIGILLLQLQHAPE